MRLPALRLALAATPVASLAAAALLAAALLAAPPLARAAGAQTTITLEGVVTGENDQPVADAAVTVTNQATAETRRAATTAAGTFRVLGLAPGRYGVQVRALGFKPAGEVVQLVVGQRARLTFQLERGSAELAGVTVVGERVKQVEVQRTSVSTPVLQQEIERLPLNTRNVMSLAAIAPGIRSFAPAQGRSLPSAGAAPDLRFINLYLDGVEMKSLFNGNLVGIPQTGSPLPADALQEFRVFLNPYDAEYSRAGAYVISAVTRRGTNEFEGSGFAFFQNKGLIARTAAQKQANLTLPGYDRLQAGLNLRGPLVRDRLFYAASYEITNQTNVIDVTPTNGAVFGRYAGAFEAPSRNHTGLLRLTYTPGERSTMDAIWSTRYLTGESNFGVNVAREGGIEQKYFINTLLLRHRYLPTARLVNELSFQLVDWRHDEPQLVPGPQLQYATFRIGTAGFPLEISETHLRLTNRATYSIDGAGGDHLLKAGVELARVSGNQYFPINREGAFTFATDTSRLPLRVAIGVGLNDPTGDSDANSELAGWITGVYLNDEWRPTPTLTLNLGLRWDAELNTLNNDFTVPWVNDPELANRAELQGYLIRGDRKNDLNNVSPRVSFSWDVFGTGQTFLRGGAGIIYDRVPSFMGFQERRDATWRTYNIESPGTTDAAVLRQRVQQGGGSSTPSFTVLKDKMETPENRQFSVGVGHQLTPTLGVNLDYIHQDIRNLYARLNVNPLVPGRGRAITARYGDIILWDDFARARSQALVAQLTFQPRQETRLNFAYTLGSNEAEYDAVTAPAFPSRTAYVMQPTTGDERHRFVLSGLTQLPFGVGVSGIVTVASPRPYGVILGVDDARINPAATPSGSFDDDYINGRRYMRPSNDWENWYRTVDLRLTKQFAVRGGVRLSAIAEVFNLFNSVNIQGFNGRQFNAAGQPIAAFQQPSGYFGSRQGQFGVRAEF